MSSVRIQSALISVYYKDGLAPVIEELARLGVQLFSTGGTHEFINGMGIPVEAVEDLTGYPSILDGRVKTLHPKVFGGILARREAAHLAQLEQYQIPPIDLVIVDLYPFEATVAQTTDESTIIEKIDIGGISLIRAAAKNYRDVAVVASRDEYSALLDLLREKQGATDLEDRRELARRAFAVTSHYDSAIFQYFDGGRGDLAFKQSIPGALPLRYGENPHQQGTYYGHFDEVFEKLGGKEISYNNLLDIDAAIALMAEFKNDNPTFAILKHNNACGIATRPGVLQAWQDALAGDPLSAFGGILICNCEIDEATATAIDQIFYEVLIAPGFSDAAANLLLKKKNRILLRLKAYPQQHQAFRSLLNGVIAQDADLHTETEADFKTATKREASPSEINDLLFANKCVKHLKSNAIALVKNQQLVGMGCGQTSRVDALQHAVNKAKHFGFDLSGAVMASDAFFPFPDCVEIADQAGITAVIQPGGSVKDQESVNYCDAHNMAMVMTGYRHFKH